MGIRDTSYYGWHVYERFSADPSSLLSTVYYRDVVEMSGTVYVAGYLKGQTGSPFGSTSTRSFVRNATTQEFLLDPSSTAPRNGVGVGGTFECITIDSNGAIYVGGTIPKTGTSNFRAGIYKSHISQSNSWNLVYDGNDLGNTNIVDLAIDSNNNIYGVTDAGATWSTHVIVSSSDGGSTWGKQSICSVTATGHKSGLGIAIDGNNKIYSAGFSGSNGRIMQSTNNGVDWTVCLAITGSAMFRGIAVDPNSSKNVYVCGQSGSSLVANDPEIFYLLSSSDGGASWYYPSYFSGGIAYDIGVDSSGNAYACGLISGSDEKNKATVMRAFTGSGTWDIVESSQLEGDDVFYASYINSEDVIYVCGTGASNTSGFVRCGKLVANSSSLGPRMLATSFGYVNSESSGTMDVKFNLNNISEFPHSSGLFQMKNMVLGTTDSGKIGKDDDSIIQVSHIGSVVHIMWPKQDADASSFVPGYGSFAPGQKPGKLSSNFVPGEFFDVTSYDHLALYGYITKALSGTLDEVIVQVERRPLRDAGFATDQAIEYGTSGSVATATYKDLLHRKEINYGDLSMTEISWPIDIPLINVKELRISAKHKFGQAVEKNKNFIVWGRLIKSDEET